MPRRRRLPPRSNARRWRPPLLQELEATEHQFTCQPSEEGVETLAQLQRAVFGPGSAGQSFTQSVYLASLAQVRGGARFCTAAAVHGVAACNCLLGLHCRRQAPSKPAKQRSRGLWRPCSQRACPPPSRLPTNARPAPSLPPPLPALQSAQALELVTAALLDVVSPSNCLSLFNVAAACGCTPLRRKARALALRCFGAAWQQDASGLLTMPEHELLGLLCSDHLQVRLGIACRASAAQAHACGSIWCQGARSAAAPASPGLQGLETLTCCLPFSQTGGQRAGGLPCTCGLD